MKNTRKKSIALAAGLAITGLVSASAASLGGIDDESLGADTDVVASCDTGGVDVRYTTVYNAGGGTPYYGVTSVEVSLVDVACQGLLYTLTLGSLASGASLDFTSGTVVLTAGVFNVAMAGAIDAELIGDIAIIISGDPTP